MKIFRSRSKRLSQKRTTRRKVKIVKLLSYFYSVRKSCKIVGLGKATFYRHK